MMPDAGPWCSPRLLLFSPNVVRLGVPLTVGVLLQDAPPGQVVKGSVFLRNPNSMRACSTEQDFTLSSQKSYMLLSLQVILYLILLFWGPPPGSLCLPTRVVPFHVSVS